MSTECSPLELPFSAAMRSLATSQRAVFLRSSSQHLLGSRTSTLISHCTDANFSPCHVHVIKRPVLTNSQFPQRRFKIKARLHPKQWLAISAAFQRLVAKLRFDSIHN